MSFPANAMLVYQDLTVTIRIKMLEPTAEIDANGPRRITIINDPAIQPVQFLSLPRNLPVPQKGETWQVVGILKTASHDALYIEVYGLIRIDS